MMVFRHTFNQGRYIKAIVYSRDIENLDQLMQSIHYTFEDIKSQNTLPRVYASVIRRAQLCIRQRGNQYQQFCN
ncbi:hypothetical protein ANTQUA_LOCUS5765 [Anthophora quadrimaculata]